MFQIIKLIGLSPEQLAALHAVLRGDDMRTAILGTNVNMLGGLKWADENDNIRGEDVFVELLSAKFDKKMSSYTVEIKLGMRIEGSAQAVLHSIVYPSIRSLRLIYDALGVYPDEPKTEKPAKRR